MSRLPKTLLAHGASYGLSKLAPGLAGVIITILVARVLPPKEYGSFSSVIIASSALATVATGWVRQSVLRLRSGDTHLDIETRSVVLAATCVSAIVSGFAMLLMYVWPALMYMLQAQTITVALLATVSASGFLVLTAVYAALLRPRRVVWAEGVRASVNILLVGLLAYSSLLTLRTAVLAVSAGAIVVLMIAATEMKWPALQRALSSAITRQTSQTMREYWQVGGVMSLWLILSLLLPIFERWVVVVRLGEHAVGEYAVVYDLIFRSLALLLFPVTAAAHPLIMRAFRQEGLRVAVIMSGQSAAVTILLFLPGLAAIYYFSDDFLGAVFPTVSSAKDLGPTLACAAFLWQLGLLAHKPLECERRNRALIACMIAAVVVDVSVSWLLVTSLDLHGAVYGSMFGGMTYVVATGIVACNALRGWNSERE